MAKLINRFDQIPSPLPPPNEGIYVVSAHASRFFNELLALMDGGANGGIGGRDMKLMSYNTDGRRVYIGIAGDHQMTGKRLGTFCAVINTQLGRVLGVFHQYAHVPEQAKSIHSRCQFQAHGNLVGDTATVGIQSVIESRRSNLVSKVFRARARVIKETVITLLNCEIRSWILSMSC
jgi:hypothetical protein